MDEDKRKKLRKEQTADLYRAVGEFTVKFEHTCHALQTAIIFMLHKAGLQQQSVAHVILAGLTAEPLKALFAALVAETQALDDDERKIVDGALNRFITLAEKRNVIIHATWFIGWGNEQTTDFSTASAIKFHKTKQGAAYKLPKYTVKDFAEVTAEATGLANIFQRLNACFLGGFKIAKNFSVESDGTVSVPSPNASTGNLIAQQDAE